MIWLTVPGRTTIADDQVEPSIAIHIAPSDTFCCSGYRSRPDRRTAQTSSTRTAIALILEMTVAIQFVHTIQVTSCQVEIAVVVDVAPGHAVGIRSNVVR